MAKFQDNKEKDNDKNLEEEYGSKFPLLPLRDLVIFPYMVVPLLVGRDRSLAAIESAMLANKMIVLATQKDSEVDNPKPEDLYKVGTASKILQVLKLPDGSAKVLVEGFKRVSILKYVSEDKIYEVNVREIRAGIEKTTEIEALMRSISGLFEKYVGLNPRIPNEITSSVYDISEPDRLADFIASHIMIKLHDKEDILEIFDPVQRLKKLGGLINAEIEILQIEKKITGQVRRQIEQSQKNYYLHEQMKAIERELGKEGEYSGELKEIKDKIEAAGMPKEVKKVALKEMAKLEKTMPVSPEATVIRNYLDWMVELPWSRATKDNLNLENAEKILEEDHYGLKKPKERILEYLAVKRLTGGNKGQILCFAGPPGVGKTSLAKSIARALGKKFVRISLGGVRDEAEIRGHRRTYIGALPGRIIQSLKKAGTKNPLFLLDEIDKLSKDFHGDPSSALLEVLDPEQNNAFNDHYLEVDFDLSQVMFIATANIQDMIHPTLRDRMEAIELPGYTQWEKEHIAEDFLVKKQLIEHGLDKSKIVFSKEAIATIINHYTREAGVRELERSIATICRKMAREYLEDRQKKRKIITKKTVSKALGPLKYLYEKKENKSEIGVATGLAWTQSGGDIIKVEAVLMPGKGDLMLTGQLGDIMQESARAALSYVRTRLKKITLPKDFHKNRDIHIHVPEGAIPKDGPSAGITIATALYSVIAQAPVMDDVAMTGEITLRGKVLPVGGIKEKVLAAHRAKVKKIILPKENAKDLKDIPNKIKRDLKFFTVEEMEEVLKHACRVV
ncbi:MAG: endopeptidase La [Candidatus Aureabacteria bacterium]|nr:endopeptidase La [Candidatus Auribacterota bacterium]